MNSLKLTCCLAAGIVIAACNFKLPTFPDAGSPGQQQAGPVSAVVGTGGGAVSNSNGSGVKIPSGALPANVAITVTQTPNAPAPKNTAVVGTPVTFGPEGQQFTTPVTVTLAFDPTQIPAGFSTADVVVFTAPVGSMAFVALPTSLADGTHVSAQTTHFSVFEPGVMTMGASDSGFIASDGGVLPNPDAGSTTSDGGRPPPPADAGPCPICANGVCSNSCPANTANCGGSCVNTMDSQANCGACGHSCDPSQACFMGACTTTCGAHEGNGCTMGGEPNGVDAGQCCPGFQVCSQGCTDVTTDDSNCGTCGNACNASESCQNGVCTPECPGSLTCFNGFCVNGCPAGSVTCNGACADTQADPNNCGACGTACASGKGCFQGACVKVCGAMIENGCPAEPLMDGGFQCCQGETQCGNSCADTTSDPTNCGACGTVCPQGDVCNNGACGPMCPGGSVCFDNLCVPGCPSNTLTCSGNCVDPLNDSSNCGGCGMMCPQGQGCSDGVCAAFCGGNSIDAGVPSKDGGISPACQNDTNCPEGFVCENGQCVGGGSRDGGTTTCGPNEMLCPAGSAEVCTEVLQDPNNCGGCGRVCGSAAICEDGTCMGAHGDGGSMCPSPGIECSGLCTDSLSDPKNCGACGVVCPSGVCGNGVCQSGGRDGGREGGPGQPCQTQAQCQTGLVCELTSMTCEPPPPDGGSTCPSPGIECNGVCTNSESDPKNCGACGNACTSGVCQNGACQAAGRDAGSMTCEPPNVECPADGGAVCTNTESDPANCGACGTMCPTGSSCSNGACASMGTVEKLIIGPMGITLSPGQTMQFHAMATYSNGSTIDATSQAAWSSSAANILTFSGAPGAAVALAAGTASVTAIFDSVSSMTIVTVSGGTDGGTGCGGTETMCGAVCVYTPSDPNNCGACGIVCPAGEGCTQGVCGCASGSTECSNGCIDTQTDPDNCGACGAACAAGETCTGGVCGSQPTGKLVLTPMSPMLPIGMTLQMDAQLISTDGTSTDVTATATWVSGTPAIVSVSASGDVSALAAGTGEIGVRYQGMSATTTVDVTPGGAQCQTDAQCPAGDTCSNGVCVPSSVDAGGTCSAGDIQCATGCVNPQSDSNNCGACGKACPAGDSCTNGACVGGGQNCVQNSDCAQGLICGPAGMCVPAPQDAGPGGPDAGASGCTGAGMAMCGTVCTNLESDPKNCGACGDVCASGEACSNGACTPPKPVSITITPQTVAVPVGQSLQLAATATFSDGSTQDVTAAAMWVSSNEAIATVSAGGDVTGVGSGDATVGAMFRALTATANVQVH